LPFVRPEVFFDAFGKTAAEVEEERRTVARAKELSVDKVNGAIAALCALIWPDRSKMKERREEERRRRLCSDDRGRSVCTLRKVVVEGLV